MALLPNINVGTAPNDGTGDTIRNAFIKVNENFQFIETFFPNTDVANLTANITSTGTSTFNTVNAATVGNAGTTFTGATVSAATIGNAGSAFTGATVSAATIGNAGSAFTGATVSAATIGNAGTLVTGTLTTNDQPNITSIGQSVTSNVTVVGNLIMSNTTINSVRSIRVLNSSNPGGSYNVGFTSANQQTATFFMNSNVNLTLVGTIESGIQKDFYFINNTGTLKSTNIFVYGNRTNKGTNVNIGVSSNTVTLIKMLATDTTVDNIVAIISNV
jgi:hypothetical protein